MRWRTRRRGSRPSTISPGLRGADAGRPRRRDRLLRALDRAPSRRPRRTPSSAGRTASRGDSRTRSRECRTAIAVDPDFGNPYNDIGSYLITLGRARRGDPLARAGDTRAALRAPPLPALTSAAPSPGRARSTRRSPSSSRALGDRARLRPRPHGAAPPPGDAELTVRRRLGTVLAVRRLGRPVEPAAFSSGSECHDAPAGTGSLPSRSTVSAPRRSSTPMASMRSKL